MSQQENESQVLLPEHCCPRDADDWDESSPVVVAAAAAGVDGGGSRSSDGVPAVAVADGDCESHLSVADGEIIVNFALVLRRFLQEYSNLSQNRPKCHKNRKKFCALQRDARPRQVVHAKM
jgi:hypothetical protein